MPAAKLIANLSTQEETIRFGESMADGLRSGDVIALTGGLGAGKTHLVKGLTRGMGSPADVSSPTFSLVHEYVGGSLPVFHFDLYRLDDACELRGIGWEDYVDGDGVCLVEWADKFPQEMPQRTRWYRLETMPEGGRQLFMIEEPPAVS